MNQIGTKHTSKQSLIRIKLTPWCAYIKPWYDSKHGFIASISSSHQETISYDYKQTDTVFLALISDIYLHAWLMLMYNTLKVWFSKYYTG